MTMVININWNTTLILKIRQDLHNVYSMSTHHLLAEINDPSPTP